MIRVVRKPLPRAVWVAASDKAEGLGRIHDPGIAAAIWRRSRDPGLAAWVDSLSPERLPCLRQAMSVTDVAAAVHAACDRLGLAPSPERGLLATDAAALALRFGTIMATPRVQVRLDVIRNNACHRFHCDRVVARLLCSYRGHGTEFGPATGQAEVTQVQTLAAGDAAIFRGTLWPGEECGLLHRSPPIAGTGETRLLMVIDLPEDEDDCDCGLPH
ncbi:DUF1826 domain-containing protein [Neotabrizicola shimadae]|uniref:DUF1826 domain-containing protein n=1 Tax=Neotabrizicola shimadae TaxID=2807096 RepID=A0A8G1EBW0_9RHOB|nr:DUF1826 domain-containing protein [Neotabrizicola shimadae]QYZ68546.1 DUF1826 domain-containing protein [Neotabrizicola shimadae]